MCWSLVSRAEYSAVRHAAWWLRISWTISFSAWLSKAQPLVISIVANSLFERCNASNKGHFPRTFNLFRSHPCSISICKQILALDVTAMCTAENPRMALTFKLAPASIRIRRHFEFLVEMAVSTGVIPQVVSSKHHLICKNLRKRSACQIVLSKRLFYDDSKKWLLKSVNTMTCFNSHKLLWKGVACFPILDCKVCNTPRLEISCKTFF